MKLSLRENVYDTEIAAQIKTEYFPKRIRYAGLRRVVDVGAHIGLFTALVKEAAPQAAVRAIEQDHANYKLLCWNVGRLPLVSTYHGRCQYVPESERWLNLRDKRNLGANTLVPVQQAHHIRPMPEEYELVPACKKVYSLELLTGGWDEADLLKLDCEGSEFNILSNASTEVLTRFRQIVGEYHVFAGNFMYLYENRLYPHFRLMEYEDSPTWGHFLLERR